ncbi:hypothetical protein HPP92_013575 [Vanilla planifolia]|uniref:Uncharacterized protein n=1 Tax=Vanilla planifolia TaxID=51239 RepID=A0A835QQB2_VANPL|nr:hypothetical protein HPP92_013575 [Vanilla planifolia]
MGDDRARPESPFHAKGSSRGENGTQREDKDKRKGHQQTHISQQRHQTDVEGTSRRLSRAQALLRDGRARRVHGAGRKQGRGECVGYNEGRPGVGRSGEVYVPEV